MRAANRASAASAEDLCCRGRSRRHGDSRALRTRENIESLAECDTFSNEAAVMWPGGHVTGQCEEEEL